MDEPYRPDTRRIVVIGPCASGKTTLVGRLRERGYDAHVCGQEHSEIAALWRRLEPDVLIGLRIELATLRRRRRFAGWPAQLYARQLDRLASGYDRADVLVDCDDFDQDAVLGRVVDWLRRHRG